MTPLSPEPVPLEPLSFEPLSRRSLSTGRTASLAVLAALIALIAVSIPFAFPHDAEAKAVDSTFTFRDALLPPGVPSVAMRDDETAMLWNPAGLAMSRAYLVSYAWKGTYHEDDRQVSTHFLLMKARGFGLGFTRDDTAPGTKVTTLFTLAPHVVSNFALGFTGKWKGGFNFDSGLMYRKEPYFSLGFVARNLRDRKNARRYFEGGVAIAAAPHRLTLFFDVINEESTFRDAFAYGGGLSAKMEYGITLNASCFTDGQHHETYRASLNLSGGVNVIEGEYSVTTNDWSTVSARVASRSE